MTMTQALACLMTALVAVTALPAASADATTPEADAAGHNECNAVADYNCYHNDNICGIWVAMCVWGREIPDVV